MSMSNWQALHSLTRDGSVKGQELAPGTTRRVLSYAVPYRGRIAFFLLWVVIDSVLVVATPLLLKSLVDDGILKGDRALVVTLAIAVGVIALVGAAVSLLERFSSSRIGEWLIFDLRTQVFGHVLREVLVRLEAIPLVLRVPSLPELPRGARVCLDIEGIDLLEAELRPRYRELAPELAANTASDAAFAGDEGEEPAE